MRKISLTVIGLYLMFLSSFAQAPQEDTAGYKSKKLRVDEVNLVSGYYAQNGNHSAVTGGIGTQKLNDVSNVLELKFVKWNIQKNSKYTLGLETGIDHHTAASQAYISKTGASNPGGTRFYPSVNWSVENAQGKTLGFGLALSSEYNYHSLSGNFQVGAKSSDRSREVNFKGQVFLDKVTMIQPSEMFITPAVTTPTFTTYTTASGKKVTSYSGGGFIQHDYFVPKVSRNTFSGSLTVSQIVNRSLQFAVIADAVAQKGLLSLPFHRVYLNTGDMKVEKLPDTRFKFPIGFRMNYFLGDRFIFRTYYRFYIDSWNIQAHTASIEVPIKANPFMSFAPFYRLYAQTASAYFAPYIKHLSTDPYYTSNYDLSKFQSQLLGLNIRFTPPKGHMIFDMIEFRVSHYLQSTGLNANNIGVNVRFK